MATVSNKKKISVSAVKIRVHATLNNLIITVTDNPGNVLFTYSAGASGAKGAKKSTSYTAEQVTRYVLDKLKLYNVKAFSVVLKGPGMTRDAVIRTVAAIRDHFIVSYISDVTPVPHNGCRPCNRRKV